MKICGSYVVVFLDGVSEGNVSTYILHCCRICASMTFPTHEYELNISSCTPFMRLNFYSNMILCSVCVCTYCSFYECYRVVHSKMLRHRRGNC